MSGGSASKNFNFEDGFVDLSLTHFCLPLRFRNQVSTFAVRETDVSRHNGGTSGAPLKPLRDHSALRALSSLRGLRSMGFMRGLSVIFC